jgi:hypothetical protein
VVIRPQTSAAHFVEISMQRTSSCPDATHRDDVSNRSRRGPYHHFDQHAVPRAAVKSSSRRKPESWEISTKPGDLTTGRRVPRARDTRTNRDHRLRIRIGTHSSCAGRIHCPCARSSTFSVIALAISRR